MTTKTKATATCILVATATAAYLTGTAPDSETATREEDGRIVEVKYQSLAAIVVADCGSVTKPGLAHLSTDEASARCRPDTRAYECTAIRVPHGSDIHSLSTWRVVGEPRVLDRHPCRADACLIDMAECNGGKASIAGHVERLTGHDRNGEEVWVPAFRICLGDGCRCAGNCVTGAPGVVESGSSEWQEVFCSQFPTDRECGGGSGDELIIEPIKEERR